MNKTAIVFSKMDTVPLNNLFFHKEKRTDKYGKQMYNADGSIMYVTNRTPKKNVTIKGMLLR